MSEESLGAIIASKIGSTPEPQGPDENVNTRPSESLARNEASDDSGDVVDEIKSEQGAKPEDDRFASKFAALSRKERMIKEREAAIAQREAEIESKLTSQSEIKTAEQLEQEIMKNPLKWLQEREYDYDKLTEMQLNEGNPTPEMLVSRMQQTFDSKFAEMEAKYQERIEELENGYIQDKEAEAQAKYDATINQFTEEITDFVNNAQDDEGFAKYELIQAHNSVDLVYEVIESHFEQSSVKDDDGNLVEPGKVLSIEEAADLVEQHLENEAKRLLEVRKLRTKLTSGEGEPESKQSKSGSVTLTNDQSASLTQPEGRKLSPDESKKRAAQLIKWT